MSPASSGRSETGWIQGALLAAVPTMTVINNMAVIPIIPRLVVVFASTPNSRILVPMAAAMPILGIALSSIVAGAIGERIGRRRLLEISTLLVHGGGDPAVLAEFSRADPRGEGCMGIGPRPRRHGDVRRGSHRRLLFGPGSPEVAVHSNRRVLRRGDAGVCDRGGARRGELASAFSDHAGRPSLLPGPAPPSGAAPDQSRRTAA